MKHMLSRVVLVVATLFVINAHANVESHLTAHRVITDKAGKTEFIAADKANPGDIIEYRMYYQNTGDKTIRGLLATGQIPLNTEFLPASDSTDIRARFKVSIDAGKTWDVEPVKRTRKTATGKTEDYIVPVSQYTHVRWVAKERLSAGEQHEYRYRVKVK